MQLCSSPRTSLSGWNGQLWISVTVSDHRPVDQASAPPLQTDPSMPTIGAWTFCQDARRCFSKIGIIRSKAWSVVLSSLVLLHTVRLSFLVQDIVFQLHRFITALDKYHKDCNEVMKEADIFPIEVDLALPTLRGSTNDDQDEDEEEDEQDNGEDLFHDDPQTLTADQRKITEDVDLLNIGQWSLVQCNLVFFPHARFLFLFHVDYTTSVSRIETCSSSVGSILMYRSF